MHRTILIAVAAMAIASCGEQGEVYQRPPAEVRDLLRTVEVPLDDTENCLGFHPSIIHGGAQMGGRRMFNIALLNDPVDGVLMSDSSACPQKARDNGSFAHSLTVTD